MKRTALSRQYATALRKHLKQGPEASLEPAHGLGRQAVSLGLETLDVARIHAEALATMEASSSRDGIIERAGIFFSEAITPIERTHRAALKANALLTRVSRKLDRRVAALAIANRSLKRGVAQRQTAEKALQTSGGHSRKLLEESRHLQRRLRQLTRRILAAQEVNRKKISHELQDEIAQTLLGINVRLLSLRQGTGAGTQVLEKEIASTRRLVDKSMRRIKRFAREFGKTP
jgi:two-component system, NarL family, sensor histidine kinase DegS